MNIAKRVGALESRSTDGRLFDNYHRIIQHVGQTRDEAVDLYGRDKIGPRDLTVIRVLVPGPPSASAS